MSGLYIHIPFCKKKCTYCDFHFSTTFESYRARMVEALCTEIHMRLNSGASERVKTLYFGGGTPSLLTAEEWSRIIDTCAQFFNIADLKEFTIEANPDDINASNLEVWKSSGATRLSIGVQSFRQEDLMWMNRAHTAEDSRKCIELAQKFGFENLTIDLMYGLPNQTVEIWEEQVHTIGKLGISHVSAYCLTVEERTALRKSVDSGILIIPDDELIEAQFNTLIETLAKYGIEQYEISNFAKPGHEAVHNSNYWLGEKYVGIGPSAHGFDGVSRYWNVSNNQQYIKTIEAGELPQTIEVLSPRDRFNELLLTGLRTKWGVSLKSLIRLMPLPDEFMNQLKNWSENGIILLENDRIRLGQSARLRADHYTATLFAV